MKVKSQKKVFIAIGAVVLVAIVCVVGVVIFKNSSSVEPAVKRMRATFSIDLSDPKAVVGNADYVFVGKVDAQNDTEYKDSVQVESEDGKPEEVASPYTNYSVTVTENIKGKLAPNDTIKIQKSGGFSKDKKECYLYEGDELPEVGKTYIFVAYAQQDGSLLLSGPMSNIPVDENNYKDSKDYKEIADAFANQIVSSRERFTSVYDAG